MLGQRRLEFRAGLQNCTNGSYEHVYGNRHRLGLHRELANQDVVLGNLHDLHPGTAQR